MLVLSGTHDSNQAYALAWFWHDVCGRCSAGDDRLGSSIRKLRQIFEGVGDPNLKAELHALLHFSSSWSTVHSAVSLSWSRHSDTYHASATLRVWTTLTAYVVSLSIDQAKLEQSFQEPVPPLLKLEQGIAR